MKWTHICHIQIQFKLTCLQTHEKCSRWRNLCEGHDTWALSRLIPSVTRLFVQKPVHVIDKETANAEHHWSSVLGILPQHKGFTIHKIPQMPWRLCVTTHWEIMRPVIDGVYVKGLGLLLLTIRVKKWAPEICYKIQSHAFELAHSQCLITFASF